MSLPPGRRSISSSVPQNDLGPETIYFSQREALGKFYAGVSHDLGGTCDRALSHISIPGGPRLEPYCPGFANMFKIFINLFLVFSVSSWSYARERFGEALCVPGWSWLDRCV